MFSRSRIKYPKNRYFLGFSGFKDEPKVTQKASFKIQAKMKCYDQYRQMKGIAELDSQARCDVESFNIVSVHLDLKLT